LSNLAPLSSQSFRIRHMVQYNVTIKLEKGIEEEWLQYMTTSHIPDLLDTGLFVSGKIAQLIQSVDDEPTYSIQYLLPSMKEMHAYQAHYAPRLQKEHTDKFKDRFVAFRTLMHIISEFSSEEK